MLRSTYPKTSATLNRVMCEAMARSQRARRDGTSTGWSSNSSLSEPELSLLSLSARSARPPTRCPPTPLRSERPPRTVAVAVTHAAGASLTMHMLWSAPAQTRVARATPTTRAGCFTTRRGVLLVWESNPARDGVGVEVAEAPTSAPPSEEELPRETPRTPEPQAYTAPAAVTAQAWCLPTHADTNRVSRCGNRMGVGRLDFAPARNTHCQTRPVESTATACPLYTNQNKNTRVRANGVTATSQHRQATHMPHDAWTIVTDA